MCKFNLIDAISTSIDPLSGWVGQKMPDPAWEYPIVAPPILDDMTPSHDPPLGSESFIPDDLQDLFLDSPSVGVPSLPSGEANSMLDDLLSAPASPQLFGALSPLSPPPDSFSPVPYMEPVELVQPLLPQPPLTPQMSMDSWVPSMSPPPADPFSPLSSSEEGGSITIGPDWSPPAKRRQSRPRPYDKQTRRQITEEERRQRKKEQNKSAATRYRKKKKEEQDTVCGDQDVLETRNNQLKEHVNTLTKELSYLKHLMQEVLKYKRSM